MAKKNNGNISNAGNAGKSGLRQVVYLHGLQSSGQSTTAQRLRRTLSKYEVISPDLSVAPEVALTELKRLGAQLRPDAIIVGTSMGGFFLIPEALKKYMANVIIKILWL